MGLFQQKPKPGPSRGALFNAPGSPQDENQDANTELNALGRKIRLMEDRYSNLHKKTTVNEQNMISYNKRLNNEIRSLNSEILDLRRLIDNVDSKLMLIIKELKLCAKKEEVELVKRYVNLWEPIRFVTRKEVETIVDDALFDAGYAPVKPKKKQ